MVPDPTPHSAVDRLAQDPAFLDLEADFAAALKEARPYLELDLVEDLEAAHRACLAAAFEAGQRAARPYADLLEAIRAFLNHPAVQALQQEKE
jgi:hypothetical protein